MDRICPCPQAKGQETVQDTYSIGPDRKRYSKPLVLFDRGLTEQLFPLLFCLRTRTDPFPKTCSIFILNMGCRTAKYDVQASESNRIILFCYCCYCQYRHHHHQQQQCHCNKTSSHCVWWLINEQTNFFQQNLHCCHQGIESIPCGPMECEIHHYTTV